MVPKTDNPRRIFPVRLTDDEKAKLVAAADAYRKTLGGLPCTLTDWCRLALLRAAENQKGKGK